MVLNIIFEQMKQLLLIGCVLLALNGNSQTFFERDTTLNVKRTAWTSGIIGAGWIGSTVSLQAVWYKEHWSDFKFFDDSKEWLGMDKFGHAYTSYSLTKDISSIYHWAGLNRNNSLIVGSSVTFGFQLTLEVLDGFSDKWGFSWSDLGTNTLGIAWHAWQDLLWKEQRFKLKFSAHTTPYAQFRPNTLGSTIAERLLKDYNGQTYWLNINPGMFLSRNSKFPKWLSFSFGYSVDEKLHGDLNHYQVITENGKALDFHAKSQFLFSLDIDFEEIPVKKPWLKTLFKALNHVKIPFPTMIITGKELDWHPFYF